MSTGTWKHSNTKCIQSVLTSEKTLLVRCKQNGTSTFWLKTDPLNNLCKAPSVRCVMMCVELTAVCGSVWLSWVVEVGVKVEVEGLQWPSLPALGRRQGQGGGSSAGLSTHERMLCRWVRTIANTSHTHMHSMHGAWQASSTVSLMQLNISQHSNCPEDWVKKTY